MAALPCSRCIGRELNICRPLDEPRLAHLLSLGGPRRLLDDGRRQIAALRVPGDCLGYLEKDGCHVFEGHALTDVEACTFDRRQYDAYAALHPDLAAATADALSAALSQAARGLIRVIGSEHVIILDRGKLLELGRA